MKNSKDMQELLDRRQKLIDGMDKLLQLHEEILHEAMEAAAAIGVCDASIDVLKMLEARQPGPRLVQ